MRISVVIPAFNNHALTNRCVDVLLQTTQPDLLAEIVVVDDASSDGTSAAWTLAQTRFKPLLLAQNRGFSGACNAGAALCTGDAILFLNTDAFARTGSLQTMRDTLAGDATIGIVGARLLYSDGSLQHAGLALLPGAASRWWHIHKRQSGTLPDANIARDFLAVTGAALLVRRTLFTQLGGFDEGFANGWEDVDLCLRAWCAGSRVRYQPRAVLEHLESATLGRAHDHVRNERRFVERWESLLADAPRYPLAEVPPIALAVDPTSDADRDDEWALAHVAQWWRAHLGASVLRTRPASRIDRARIDVLAAVARRRPTLEIAWGDACLAAATGSQRVALVAPQSAAQARSYARARDITAWWTPTDMLRNDMLAAGALPDRVTTVRLGAQTSAPGPRVGAPVVAVARHDAAILHELERCLPQVRTVLLRGDEAPDLRAVDIVFATRGGDRWGLLLPAAIGHGCSFVTTAPIDPLAAAAPGVTIVAERQVFATLVAKITAIGDVRALASDIYLDARRRLDAYLATQHVSELARALTGGTPTTALVEVDAAYAQRLHGATYRVADGVL